MAGTLGRGRRLAATVTLTSCLLLIGVAGTALASDYDGDGSSTPADCNDFDPAVFPGAIDKPELGFEDTDCDGIDGDAGKAIFVDAGAGQDSPTAGTKESPLKTIGAAITRAKAEGKDVYVTAGVYPESLTLQTGVGVYGGYTPTFAARTGTQPTRIDGNPAAVADDVTGVVLQMLTLTGGSAAAGGSSYGLIAVNGATVALDHVTALGGQGGTGATGGIGTPGSTGGTGSKGGNGSCGGVAGTGPVGGTGANDGGKGGNGGGAGGNGAKGDDGAPQGSIGTGGAVGIGNSTTANPIGGPGGPGNPGSTGFRGADGGLPPYSLDLATAAGWAGASGKGGVTGVPGTGGGGGGGGGGASVPRFFSAGGGAGGSGGAGGGGGGGGQPGAGGGGSFGVYVFDASVVARDSVLRGGAGGNGGNGGPGGPGGSPGLGGGPGTGARGGVGTGCGDGVAFSAKGGNGGKGGDGGAGGPGGAGSGGTGGPSTGVYRGGAGSSYSQRDTIQTGAAGGVGGRVPGSGAPSASGPAGGLLQSATAGALVGDFDFDGVSDPDDDCPSVAAVAGVNGCPTRPAKLVDTDGDGVPDTGPQGAPIDKCPTVAPPPGSDGDGDGCADPPPGPAPIVTPVTQPSPGGGGPPVTQAPERIRVALTFVARPGARSSRFTTLKVRKVPRGAKVNVTCKGTGCPKGLNGKGYTKRHAFGVVDLRRFIKKPLRVGITITVVVSKPNAINAVKILKVRKSKAPSVSTRCTRPGSTEPVACT